MDDIIFDPKTSLVLGAIQEVIRYKVEVSLHPTIRSQDVRGLIERIDNLYAVLPLTEDFEAMHAEYRDDIRKIVADRINPERNKKLWGRIVYFFRREVDYANKTVFATAQRPGLRIKKLEDEKLAV